MAIRFDDVTVDFGSAVPIKNMSVTLPEEGLCIVTGVSGAGKSTLLKLIAGLVKPTSGNISGTDGLKLSYVFQEDRLLEWNTAKENLMFVRSDEASAEFWLNAMELGDRFDSYPAELSGGMCRRVAIARAMHLGGDVLLLDEPFKGLDGELKVRVAEHTRGRFGLIVAAVHSKEEAELLSDGSETLNVHIQ